MKFLYYLFFYFIIISNLPAQIWTQIHDLGKSEQGYEINVMSDGNFLISGKEWGFDDNSSKYKFTKIKADGEVLWDKVYEFGFGGDSYSHIFTFTLPENQGFYVIGNTSKMISKSSGGDIFILRLNEQGDSLWSKTIGTENSESLSAAFMIENEWQFVFLHTSYVSGQSEPNYYLSKVDLNGEYVWNHKLQIDKKSNFNSLIQSPEGNFIASGTRTNVINNQYDALIIKLDSEGSILWEKTYGGDQWDFFFDLEINKYGNPLFFGTTGSTNSKGFYIVETDWSGNVLSEKIIPSLNGGYLALPHPRMEVLKLFDNSFIIIADGYLGICNNDDFQIYWLDSDANYFDDIIFGTPINHEKMYNAIQFLDQDILIIGGYFDWNETDLLLVKIKNELSTNINTINFDNAIFQVYPNPFNETIQLNIPEIIELPIMIQISDISGRILFIETINQHQLKIESSMFTEGIFFLKLQTKDWIQAVKIVKI